MPVIMLSGWSRLQWKKINQKTELAKFRAPGSFLNEILCHGRFEYVNRNGVD
jgi:hypothetical protein